MKSSEPPLCMYGPPEMLFRRKEKAEQQLLKQIEVVAAVLRNGNSILATQRGYGPWQGWWEFPGGKVKPGETRHQALIRELREEMDTDIIIDRYLTTVEYDYPEFHLTMHCYLCHLASGTFTLKEHLSARWLTADNLQTVQWLPADQDLIADLASLLDPHKSNTL